MAGVFKTHGMKTLRKNVVLWSAVACCLTALCSPAARGQKAIPTASSGGVSWQVTSPNDSVSLRVRRPDGTVFEEEFSGGQSPAFTSPTGVLPDGSYTYELRLARTVSKEAQAQTRNIDTNREGLDLRSGLVQSGSFRVVNGAVKLPDASAVEAKSTSRNTPSVPQETFISLTIQSNAPVLHFDDNSSTPGFPTTDWDIVANDPFSGGAEKFSILDVTTNTVPFTIEGGAPDNSLTISSNGYIGLGTIVPTKPLHVRTTSGGFLPTLRLEAAGVPRTWDVEAGAAGLWFKDVTTGTVPLVLRNNTGRVGLGVDDPQGKLHVLGAGDQLSIFQSSDNNAVQFRLQTNSINRRFVALNAAGTQQSQLLFGDNGAFDFLGPTAADVRMRFLANGNVGIGTTAPTQKLSVNGTAGKPGGGSWATFSDERLKDIKGEFKSGLDEVMKLKPIRYEYKADNAEGITSEGEHIGFGAQEVRKIIPEAVTAECRRLSHDR